MKDLFFNIESYPRKVFSRHFLKSVHCEFGIHGLTTDHLLSCESYLEQRLSSIGLRKINYMLEGQVKLSPDNDDLTTSGSKKVGIRYGMDHPKKVMTLTADSITFGDHSYEGFEKFSEWLNQSVSIISSLFEDLSIKKIGLRKINSLIIEPVESYDEACSIFNPNMFGMLRGGAVKFGSLRSTEETLTVERNQSLGRIQAKLQNSEHENRYQAVLDFDLVSKDNVSFYDYQETLKGMNEDHFDLFMWAITDEMIKALETESGHD